METDDTKVDNEIDWWTHDRVVNEVPFPQRSFSTKEEVYSEGKPSFLELKKIFKREGRLEKSLVLEILKDGGNLLKDEPNLLHLDEPITICGDVHGQFYDLVRLFEIGGNPESTQYLFLGDYVDRGYFSCECVLLLLSYKINYPKSFYMLRGNHECRHLTQYFTFKNECLVKYDEEIYEAFCDCFNCLPLAAIVNNQFFCVHGGLSPQISCPADVMKINRYQEPPAYGPFCDLLWSDPSEDYDKEDTTECFLNNAVRGCSYKFTYTACCNFLKNNNLLCVVRAHEAQDTGFRMYRKSGHTKFPSLITVFSAPNYLDMYNNGGAILKYENNLLNIKQFKHSKHPYWLPNMINAFTWSVPFVGEKIMDIMEALLKICSEEELVASDSEEDEKAVKTEHDMVRSKVLVLGRISRLLGVMRRQSQSAIELNGLSPVNSEENIQEVSQKDSTEDDSKTIHVDGNNKFNQAKMMDMVNEKLPPGLASDEDHDVL